MFISRIRAALASGIALAAMTASLAQADELSSLKTELNSLQGRIDRLQSDVAAPSEASVSVITMKRGAGEPGSWGTHRPGDALPLNTGLNLAITPAADLPAPIRSVTIGGYVKGDLIYDFDQDLGDDLNYARIGVGKRKDRVRLHARQSRFNIKSITDTGVGQIRTLIEGDFFSSGGTDFRLRHAWGEWDMTPNWTLGAGQYWRNFMSPITGITTVDMKGDVGLIGRSRSPQLRLSWIDGPLTATLSVEQPSGAKDLVAYGSSKPDHSFARPAGAYDNAPDISARLQYDLPGDSEVVVSGMARNYHLDRAGGQGGDDAIGWGIQGAVNVAVADPVLLTASVMYGEGLGNYVLGAPFGAYAKDGRIKLVEQMGVFAGASVSVTDTTTLNFGWGYLDQRDSDVAASAVKNASVDVMSAHANVIWQPVSQLRLGAELMWAERERLMAGGTRADDAWRGQVGAWFFF